MIDDIEKAESLVERMRTALPMPVRVRTDALQALREKSPSEAFPNQFNIVDIRYTGDEGGVLCHLEFSTDTPDSIMPVISITHLAFDRGNPLWRDIERYRKHRIKRLRKLQTCLSG
jgi:hypothetical protein